MLFFSYNLLLNYYNIFIFIFFFKFGECFLLIPNFLRFLIINFLCPFGEGSSCLVTVISDCK